jgi:CBS domain-containing protein
VPVKKCSDVMTKKPVCCLPGDAVSKAAQMMNKENVGSIPVIENQETGKLIGILTDRDLAIKVIANERDAKSTKVSDVMTQKVISCHLDEDIQKAVDAMAKHQLRRMPVVDNDFNIVGIISQADVATRINKPEETAAMVKDISQPLN